MSIFYLPTSLHDSTLRSMSERVIGKIEKNFWESLDGRTKNDIRGALGLREPGKERTALHVQSLGKEALIAELRVGLEKDKILLSKQGQQQGAPIWHKEMHAATKARVESATEAIRALELMP